MKTSTLKIGQLAKRSGLTTDTIRFYEKSGLLPATERNVAGYRLYNEDDLARLAFIQRAKTVGFTLTEITELLELRLHPDEHTCAEVKLYTEEKINLVQQKIIELKRIEQSLQALHSACCGGPESAQNCSILQLLDSEAPL